MLVGDVILHTSRITEIELKLIRTWTHLLPLSRCNKKRKALYFCIQIFKMSKNIFFFNS